MDCKWKRVKSRSGSYFFFQAEDGVRDYKVTGVQTCALPIYRKPRELVWIFGCAIFLVLMAEAFMGYLLPWGQMSYWGAQVIVNLFSAIPFIGPDLALLIRGDYVVGEDRKSVV